MTSSKFQMGLALRERRCFKMLAILLTELKVRTWCISLIAWADSACPLTPS